MLADISHAAVQAAADTVTTAGHRASPCPSDVSDERHVADMVDRPIAGYGKHAVEVLAQVRIVGSWGTRRVSSRRPSWRSPRALARRGRRRRSPLRRRSSRAS